MYKRQGPDDGVIKFDIDPFRKRCLMEGLDDIGLTLEKGDSVEIALVIGDKSLLHNTETLAEDQANYLLQAGKRGVPAGGWPEGHYHAELKITRDGKPLIEQSSTPVAFE